VRITRLELDDFRNYAHFTLEPSPRLTVLVGPNAAGKTNVIEAVQLVTAAQSFRRPAFSEVVRWGADNARVRLTAQDGPRLLETTLSVDAEGHRSYQVNSQAKRRFADVAGVLPSVVFTPDDLGLVKGPAERRRSAVDDLGDQLSPTYASIRRDYQRVVKQRNALLKEGSDRSTYTEWDGQLITLGAKVVVHRRGLLERVMRSASERYKTMAGGEELGYRYADRCGLRTCSELTAETIAAAMGDELARRRGEEQRRGVTLVGPHRDDVVFTVGGHDAKVYASQGQQRTIALAFKLAEVAVVREVLRRDPVLLLDDVMSELDAARRTALSELVSSEIQTIVTTTNTGYFNDEMLQRACVVQIPGSAS
jgi:DNA replication and repair protein RecF